LWRFAAEDDIANRSLCRRPTDSSISTLSWQPIAAAAAAAATTGTKLLWSFVGKSIALYVLACCYLRENDIYRVFL